MKNKPMAISSACIAATLFLSGAFAADALDTTAATPVRAPVTRNPQAIQRALSANRLLQAQLSRAMTNTIASNGAKVGGSSQPDDLVVNPARAYPPSCLNDGLPFQANYASTFKDPIQTATVALVGDPIACFEPDSADEAECDYAENVTVNVWKVACSAGTSATVLEIDRATSMNGTTSLYPVLPSISIAQGTNISVVRVASDPNTINSNEYSLTPMVNSSIYVLENFVSGGNILFNFNQPFTLTVDGFTSNTPTTFNVPAYNPALYAAAAKSLPLTGYESGNFFDPNHIGEGINIEIGEVSTTERFLAFNWFTFDDLGMPFWLSGSNTFTVGDTSVSIDQTFYSTNGGFAGDFGAKSTPNLWGTTTFTFPDCGHLTMTYASVPAVVAPTPHGSNTLHWTRATSLNSLTCQ